MYRNGRACRNCLFLRMIDASGYMHVALYACITCSNTRCAATLIFPDLTCCRKQSERIEHISFDLNLEHTLLLVLVQC